MYVTHDQVEAMTMGHRIAVIDDGVLRQVDEPEVVYEHPADLVVADFVGSPPMNVVPVRQELRNGRMTLSGDGIDLHFLRRDLHARLAAVVGEAPADVMFGVRPEYLRISEELGPDQTFRAQVERVELIGSERLVHLVAGSVHIAARVPTAVRPTPGDNVPVGIVAAGVRLFDRSSGRLLSG